MRLMFALGFGLCTLPAIAGQALRTAAETGSEPKFVATAAHVEGLCPDILQALAEADTRLVFSGGNTLLPQERIEGMIAGGQLDLACGFRRTEARQRRYLFSAAPVFQVRFKLAARNGDAAEVVSPDSLRSLTTHQTVLLNSGSGQIDTLKQWGITVDALAATPADNLRKLAAGRGRFYVYREPGLAQAIREAGLDSELKVLPFVLETVDYYLIYRPDLPSAVRGRLDNTIRQLAHDGTLLRIAQRWHGP